MSQDSGTQKDCRAAELGALAALAANPDRPTGILPFERLVRDEIRQGELAQRRVKVIGQFCNFVPDELVLALGAVPLRLETGCHAHAQVGTQRLSSDQCPAIRAAYALGEGPEWPLSAADLVVVPTSCDGKKKLAALLARRVAVFTLELPPANQGERAKRWWLDEIHRLIGKLEEVTGNRLGRRPLREAIAQVNHRAALVRRLQAIRTRDPSPINGADHLLVMATSFIAEPGFWIARVEELIAELEEKAARPAPGPARPRILLTGSPVFWPDFKLPLAILRAGADVVADDLCSGTARLDQPTVVDEDTKESLIRAAAERVLLPCACPCFIANELRRDRLFALIARHRIHGVIHHTLRCCQLYDADAKGLAADFQARGVPFLELTTEFAPEEEARIQVRVDAFVEMLLAHQKPSHIKQ